MEKKIYTALASIMREVWAIGKNNKNVSQNFAFRGVEDVMNELHGLFAKNNVVIQTRIISAEKTEKMTKNGGIMFHTIIQVVFRFIAEDGSHLSCRMIGEAMDSADKGLNKAVSVALKYALTTMFLVPTKEFEDPDKYTHDLQSLQTQINGCNTIEDLQQVWGLNKKMQNDKNFQTAIKQKKQKITEQKPIENENN